ncbi:hypothetical protein M2336_002489 [Sphingobium sp. B1D7B]|nr:transferrin-binding protein-like solute binding protein [Sphingobium sp. B11D3A]MCW2405860.1 hypothetical protein [Sphingobium sp. B1D7B]
MTPSPTYAKVYNFANGFIINSIMAESSYRKAFDSSLKLIYDTATPATASIWPTRSAAQINLQASPLLINLISGSDHRVFSENINVFRNSQLTVSNIDNSGPSSVGAFFALFNAFDSTINQTSYVGFSHLLLTNGANSSTRTPFTQTQKYFLFGSHTVIDDLPKSGTLTYKVQITGSTPTYNTVEGFWGDSSVTLNFDTNQLRGSLVAHYPNDENGVSNVIATLNFIGTFDPANNEITGNITSSDSSFRGTLKGSLFGPRGIEIGFLYAIQSDLGGVVGGVAGLQR